MEAVAARSITTAVPALLSSTGYGWNVCSSISLALVKVAQDVTPHLDGWLPAVSRAHRFVSLLIEQGFWASRETVSRSGGLMGGRCCAIKLPSIGIAACAEESSAAAAAYDQRGGGDGYGSSEGC